MRVRVYARIRPPRFAQQLERAVRDHLVGVHVGGGARAPLDHVDDEMLVVPAGAQLLRRGDDRVPDRGVEQAQLRVRAGRGLFDGRQRVDQGRELPQDVSGDRKVLDRPQRLDAEQRVVGHVALAKQVVLAPMTISAESKASKPFQRRSGCRHGRGKVKHIMAHGTSPP